MRWRLTAGTTMREMLSETWWGTGTRKKSILRLSSPACEADMHSSHDGALDVQIVAGLELVSASEGWKKKRPLLVTYGCRRILLRPFCTCHMEQMRLDAHLGWSGHPVRFL